MPRAGQRLKTRKPAPVKPAGRCHRPADPLAHNRLILYLEEHFEWMRVTGYSPETVRARRQAIRRFITWCDERDIDDPRQISRAMLERYQRHLFYYRKEDGAPLTVGMQLQYLAPLKTWFKWLTRAHHIPANPAADLELPQPPKSLPRAILSVDEVEAVLREADPGNAQGLRDRALLETLYATGVRRMEVIGVDIYDVDFKRGLLWVKHGKGGRERVVPLGERAMAWLDKYLTEARPQLATADTDALFLSDYGERIQPHQVASRVKRYMHFAGIDKPGATHLLRHACATHMLEGGADIRYIQEMLGHANLETTEIYTHVSIDKLVAVHRATHPSRLERHRDGPQPSLGDAPENATAAFLAALQAEDEGEAAEVGR